jgi:DNA-binding transcriptional regulator YiaG
MFFEFEEMGYLQRKANILYREKNGYLTGDEIKAIRSKYRYSQEVFEALIRSGKKSLTRWENNSALQTGPVDTLLRLIDCFPFVVRWLENPECFYRYSSPYTVGGEIENSFEIQRPVGTRTELEKELVA